MSNLKQIALGWQMYAQDFDERVSPNNAPAPPSYPRVWNATLISPYIKNSQIWECPSYTQAFGPGDAGNCEQRTRKGIGYNWTWTPIEGPGGDMGWISYKKLAALNRPAEFIIYGDAGCMGFGVYNNTGTFAAWQTGLFAPMAGQPGTGTKGHNEGLNLAFADGHVKWSKPNNLTHNQFCRVSGMPDP